MTRSAPPGALGLLAAALLLVAASAAPASAWQSGARVRADTVLEVRRGDALVLETLEGRLVVEGWDQDRVAADGDASTLRHAGNRVTLDPVRDRRRERRLRLRVPRWMPVTVSGRELEIEVEGLTAPVSLRTLEGDIRVTGVEGTVDVRSVDGEVSITRVTGAVTAMAVGDAIYLRDVRGDVHVESTDGDLVLERVDGARVEAVTVDGDVSFDGPLHRGGRYRFVTHDGDVTVRIPRDAAADVTVSTYDGEFSADFPVVLERFRGGREMHFRVGAGGAALAIQAFDGDIRLGWR